MDNNNNTVVATTPNQPPGAGVPNQPPTGYIAKTESKKTTPDEGKSYDKETVFVCVQDCWQNNTRYFKGDTIKGNKCPAWFVAAQKPEKEK